MNWLLVSRGPCVTKIHESNLVTTDKERLPNVPAEWMVRWCTNTDGRVPTGVTVRLATRNEVYLLLSS